METDPCEVNTSARKLTRTNTCSYLILYITVVCRPTVEFVIVFHDVASATTDIDDIYTRIFRQMELLNNLTSY